jgi:hypothetical protein
MVFIVPGDYEENQGNATREAPNPSSSDFVIGGTFLRLSGIVCANRNFGDSEVAISPENRHPASCCMCCSI